MEPYDGQEPYIFISYARKDKERVTPFLDALSGAGYRVWYDAGIQAGEHWTETLVKKVEACAVFCPLFSEAFNASRFCFEETEYAYRKDKPIVPAYLEELKSDDLRPLYRLLGSRQHLRLDDCTPAQFAERLDREQVFALCKVPEWNKVGEIQWRLSADGVLTIAKNEDLPKLFSLPGSIPPYQHDPVYGGSTAPWTPYRKRIVSVTIRDDIDAIGDFSFAVCKNLTDVGIPDSVTEIGDGAFALCESLADVRIPNGVTKIGNCVFAGCTNLTNVRIPDGVIEICAAAFADCKNLTNVHIPDSVTEIDESAFLGCERLTDKHTSDSVTKIGDEAFKKRLTGDVIPAKTRLLLSRITNIHF